MTGLFPIVKWGRPTRNGWWRCTGNVYISLAVANLTYLLAARRRSSAFGGLGGINIFPPHDVFRDLSFLCSCEEDRDGDCLGLYGFASIFCPAAWWEVLPLYVCAGHVRGMLQNTADSSAAAWESFVFDKLLVVT